MQTITTVYALSQYMTRFKNKNSSFKKTTKRQLKKAIRSPKRENYLIYRKEKKN